MWAPAIVVSNRTPRQRARTAQARPRNPFRLVAGWIADLIALRKSVALCPACEAKVPNAVFERAGYVNRRSMPFVSGPCDGCQEFMTAGRLWVHQDRLPR